MSPGEFRKTYREGVPVSDTQIREVKAPSHDEEGGEVQSEGEI